MLEGVSVKYVTMLVFCKTFLLAGVKFLGATRGQEAVEKYQNLPDVIN